MIQAQTTVTQVQTAVIQVQITAAQVQAAMIQAQTTTAQAQTAVIQAQTTAQTQTARPLPRTMQEAQTLTRAIMLAVSSLLSLSQEADL